MVRIWTSRISYRGDDAIDITVKSGKGIGANFAPTWQMVWDLKKKRITPEQYTERYTQLMRQRYAANPEPFKKLLLVNEITLCCYCKKGDFCHRLLLVDILEKIAKHENVAFERGGERE